MKLSNIDIPRDVLARGAPLVTVSGSFNRHLEEVREAIGELTACGAYVLSPRGIRPRGIVAKQFLLLEGDLQFPHRSIKDIQDRHNACIAIAHFHWLVCPHGYVGTSSAFEIGIALYEGVPICATTLPSDPKISQYITLVRSIPAALERHHAQLL